MHSKMRVVLDQFQTFNEEMAKLVLQLGVPEIQMNTPTLPGEKIWTFEAFKNLEERIESYGLKRTVIENAPLIFYDKVILDLPRRDKQTENYCQTIRNVGKLGIPMLGHHLSPILMWRITAQAPGRGGAKAIASGERQLRSGDNAFREKMARKCHPLDYSVSEVVDEMTADDLPDNYRYSIDAALPATEKVGVVLVLHPNDPSLRGFRRVQRMVTSLEDYKRAVEIGDSSAWGVNPCLDCCSEKGGRDCILEMIRYPGVRKRVLSVHFQGVQGALPYFQGCFLGEGNYDPTGILYELGRAGYRGITIEDHVLRMDYGLDYGRHARSHEIGYIWGMIQMMDFVCGEK